MSRCKFLLKNIPNSISTSRIIASVIMVFFNMFTIPFYILYIYCGFSDVMDGFLARKFNITSEIGAKIDSVADAVFVIVSAIKIVPNLILKKFIYIWIIAIIIIKLIAFILARVLHKSYVLHHTFANKITGICLFFIPFIIKLTIFSWATVITCGLATFASLHELYYVVVKKL